MPNRFNAITSKMTGEAQAAQINKNFAELDREAVTKVFKKGQDSNAIIQGRLPNDLGYGQILYDNDGNAAIYMAIDADGNPIFKVAKEGFDATTASDGDLVFNSSRNMFKIIDSGTANVEIPGSPNGTYSISVPYPANTVPAGSVPAVVAYAFDPSTSLWYSVPWTNIILGSPNEPNISFYVTVNSTNVTFNVTTDSGFITSPVTFKYFIMAESISS